jgi:nitrogen regulatory protein P-II 1
MKEIKAFIKPNRVEQVVDTLKENGFESVTLSKGEGTGAYKREDAAPSLDFHFTDSPVVKLELVCHNEVVEKVIKLICEKARSADPGDGIIYVTDINEAYRVKTGEYLHLV